MREALARFAGATKSPIQLVAVGAQAASPIPTPRRDTISIPKLVTKAAKAVRTPQMIMPPPRETFAAPNIGDPAEGDSDDGVEDGERRAQQAHLRVIQVELLAHGFD